MTILKLVSRSLRHNAGSSIATAAGIAIATAVICGAIIIGDSLRHSLLGIVNLRLGNVTHSITAGDRLFTTAMAREIDARDYIDAVPVLKTRGVALVQGTGYNVSNINVWGVDTLFAGFMGVPRGVLEVPDGEVAIGENVAARLGVQPGDFIILRMNHKGPIPANTPLVSEAGQTLSRRVRVNRVLYRHELSGFNLQAIQTTPLNVFVNLHWLNRVMELNGRANLVLVNNAGHATLAELQQVTRDAWQPGDGGLTISELESPSRWVIKSERVFIDEHISSRLSEKFPGIEKQLTYLVNSIAHRGNKTPYSFVAATNRHFEGVGQLGPGEIIVNSWLANDLQLTPGDTVNLEFFTIGPMRELSVNRATFTVNGILPLERSIPDSILMPHLPGMSDAASCAEWEAGIPVDFQAIRPVDEEYWNMFKGTPKAYISLEQGQYLWQNRFGNITSAIISNDIFDETRPSLAKDGIDPFRLAFQINPVREEGIAAARGGVDFSQLFAGLGMFIILAGAMLTLLILKFSLKTREKEVMLMVALGFSSNRVNNIFLAEAAVIILLGALAGLFLSFGYSGLIIEAINQVWHDIIRMDLLSTRINLVSLLPGVFAGFILGMAAVYFTIKSMVSRIIAGKKASGSLRASGSNPAVPKLLFVIFTLTFFALAGYLLLFPFTGGLLKWLLAGLALLGSLVAGIYLILYSNPPGAGSRFNTWLLSWRNLRRNPARSFLIVVLLAMGSYVIVLTAFNRRITSANPGSLDSGTGGFLMIAESTLPVLNNLNLPEARSRYRIPPEVSFVQFFSAFDDDASCLNLNRVQNPRLIATNPGNLRGRFSFATATDHLNPHDPWLSLNNTINGLIPAIADQSVIQWGLGKSVGDTLLYTGSRGDTIKVLLVGGLVNSVFQGNVIISDKHFLDHFNPGEGANFFLVDAPMTIKDEVVEMFQFSMRDHGWELFTTWEKMAEFDSVQNVYLAIFSLLGAVGLLIGTVGLAVVLARSLIERKNEIAILTSLGYKFKTIIKIFFNEFLLLLLAGILIGTVAAMVSTMPTLLHGNPLQHAVYMVSIISVVIINGCAWIFIISYSMVRRLSLPSTATG